jgi:hypothetical protein
MPDRTEGDSVDRLHGGLISDAIQAMRKLQERTGLTEVDIAKRALILYEFVEAEIRAGNEILVKNPDDTLHKIKFFFLDG